MAPRRPDSENDDQQRDETYCDKRLGNTKDRLIFGNDPAGNDASYS